MRNLIRPVHRPIAWWLLAFVLMLVATGAAMCAPAVHAGAAPIDSPKAPPGTHLLCEHNEHMPVHLPGGKVYQIRNPYWRGSGQACIHWNGGTGFRVVKTPAPGRNVTTFPDVMRGCLWNICTPNTNVPIRVSNIRSAKSSWRIGGLRASGTYNEAYDIWFGKHRQTQGHNDGAELMVFLGTHNCCGMNNPERVQVGPHTLLLQHWVAYDAERGMHWNYIQFRYPRQHSSVRGLDLKALIKIAERRGLIKPWWWMNDISAGFEIWDGGVGLTTKSYHVNVTPLVKLR